jgi:Cu+-exporting ATPase
MDQHAHCHAHHHEGASKDAPSGKYDTVPADYHGTVYTCPMHPEVRQVKPGDCPICGMGLEPETAAAGEEDTSELDDMTRRFWISAVLTLPLFLYAMSEMIPGNPVAAFVPAGWAQWIQFALATPVVLWGGWPLLVRGAKSLRTMNLNMFTLIGLGVSVAFVF